MIVILEKSEIFGNRASVAREAPLEELDLLDVLSREQLTLQSVQYCNLLIVTDRLNNVFRIFKDRYDIFGVFEEINDSVLFPMEKLNWLIDSYNRICLYFQKQDYEEDS